MRTLTLAVVVCSLALAIGSIQALPAPIARANHDDGHLHDWDPSAGAQTALLQKLVSGPTPTLCSDEFPASTQTAAQRWRETAGTAGGTTIDLFAYQSNCAGADVVVKTAGFSICIEPGEPPPHMCVLPTSPFVQDYGLVLPITIYVNPSLFGPGLSYPDDDDHTTADITHELGHALGHADYTGCGPGGQATVMDTNETCAGPSGRYTTPQQLDIDNYHNAYHADAVASFAGTSGGQGPHAVRFTWDGSDIHNEREYLINWRNNCTGQWQPLYAPPKNSSSKTLTGLQGGLQEFQILPLTDADPQHAPPFAGEARNVIVNVASSLSAPSGMAASFPSTTVNRSEWPAVVGAHHYKIRADRVPSGVDFPTCIGEIEGTQYDHALPVLQYRPLYYRVMACTSPPADLCSPLSAAFTFSDRFDAGAWEYVFTYYRSVDDINLDFINFNPTAMALQLHIRNGDAAGSPLVVDSGCIPAGTISTVGPMPASSFTSGKLATQGHGIFSDDTCASTHSSDSSTVGSGQIPPYSGPCCPTPTPTPDPAKPAADGNVSGVYDLEVLLGPDTIYHCVSRFDHEASSNDVKANTVCYADIEIGDPANVLSGVNVPGEGPDGGGGANAGPPVPPPYTNLQPFKGLGSYNLGLDQLTFEACVARTGAGALGPNLLIRVVLTGLKAGDVSNGTAELYPGATNDDCDSLNVPTGGAPLTMRSTKASAATPVAWRTSATDLDGDGCTDSDELAKPNAIPKGCGDDPYNPADSNQTDYSGSYEILIEVTRADLYVAGSYFSCLAGIQQTGNGKDTSTTTPGLTARAFCYTDGSSPVNLLGYPGVTGDGYPGGGPAWGAIPANGAPEADCTRYAGANPQTFLDEDSDGTVNDGCPSEGFADTDSKQTELLGYVDNVDNTLKLRGCFEDEDDSEVLKNVYVEITVNKNTGIGTVDIWSGQALADCAPVTPHAWGDYINIGGTPLAAFDDTKVSIVRQPGGQDRDTDQDGASNAEELRDDGANCGLRDPFNPYDWYDVNQDGVIDQANDILGVIQHYSPAGAPPYDIAYDRGKPITGGAGNWSREAPDGAIDLSNDILGVIQQYHPGAC